MYYLELIIRVCTPGHVSMYMYIHVLPFILTYMYIWLIMDGKTCSIVWFKWWHNKMHVSMHMTITFLLCLYDDD